MNSAKKLIHVQFHVQRMYCACILQGCLPPPSDSFLVRSTLLGAKRLLGNTQFSSDPLLPRQLIKIMGTLNFQNSNDLVFWCAIVLAFRGLLRKSLICKGENNLLRSDIQSFPWGIINSIRKSKTIQFKDRVHQVPIAQVGGPLCAVTHLQKMYRTIPTSRNQPLFGLVKNNVYRPIKYE